MNNNTTKTGLAHNLTRFNKDNQGLVRFLSYLRRWTRWGGPLLAFLAFLPGLGGYFSGEDFVFIRFVASGKAFYEPSQNLFYRPLPNLLWQLDYSLWGLQPFGYHLTNLLVHVLNTALVSWLARYLVASELAGLIAASLFAMNPLHVEAVVWVAGRPDLLATFFFLVALYGGLKYFAGGKWPYYVLSLIAYAASQLSKESAVGLPVFLLMLVLSMSKPDRALNFRQLVRGFLPYFGLIGVYLVIRLLALGGIGGYGDTGQNLFYILWNATFGLWLPLFFPLNIDSAGGLLTALLAIGLLAFYGWVVVGLAGCRLKELIVASFPALLFIYITLIPALGNTPVSNNLAQSRLLYLPSVGFCVWLALLAGKILGRVPAPKNIGLAGKSRSGWPVLVIGFLYLAALLIAVLPWLQAGRLVEQTYQLLRTQNLPVRDGDTLYYEGLPDSFEGAYVWRNGLDEATKLWLGPGLTGIYRTENLIVDYRKAATGTMWFVRFNPAAAASLNYEFTYSVDDSKPPPGSFNQAGKQNWDFTNCLMQGWNWNTGQGSLNCQNGQGLLFNTQGQKTNLSLTSPALNLSKPGVALELSVYGDYDFQQPTIASEIALSDLKGQIYFRQPFDLAADGKTHRYRLMIPVSAQASGPFQLSLKLNRTRSNVLWRAIAIAY
jgi:hypothetical protein